MAAVGWRGPAGGVFAVAWGASQFVSLLVAYREQRGISTAVNDGLFGIYAVGLELVSGLRETQRIAEPGELAGLGADLLHTDLRRLCPTGDPRWAECISMGSGVVVLPRRPGRWIAGSRGFNQRGTLFSRLPAHLDFRVFGSAERRGAGLSLA